MAEEIIDIRERIEKMRIQIENEAINQTNNNKPMETQHKMSSSNISLSIKNELSEAKSNDNIYDNSRTSNANSSKVNSESNNKEFFPSVSLSVKNPVSNKILVILISLQLLSNIGIFYFLFMIME